MKQFQLPLFLLFILVGLVISTFCSLSPGDMNYEIQGKIDVKKGDKQSVTVFFLKEKDQINGQTLADAYRVFTSEDGTFKAEFGAEINSTIQIYLQKKGFIPVLDEIQTSSHPGKEIRLEKAILLAVASKPIDVDHYYGDTEMPVLPVFKTQCDINNPTNIPQTDILYLKNVSQQVEKCPNGMVDVLKGTICTKTRNHTLFFEPQIRIVDTQQPPSTSPRPQISEKTDRH